MDQTTRQIVVITGVTKGLGRAMAAQFAEYGVTVLGCGRTPSAIEELRRLPHFLPSSGQASGHALEATHDFEVVDVADADQVNRWAQNMLKRWGTPKLLLNNASVINRNAPLWKVSAQEFDTVIDVNIKGMANTIRAFAPAMIERQSGVIVNFSSGWGRSTDPYVAPYCATKWAIEGLTQAFAQELPDGMAAVTVDPGIINTAMLRSCLPDSAVNAPTPWQWAQKAVPFFLSLGPQDNGKQLTVQ